MKAKVAHLIKKIEEIERDTVELKKLTDRISDDREYSPILKESFLSEMQKLEEQKSEILRVSISQVTANIAGKMEKPSEAFPVEAIEVLPPHHPEKKKTDKPIRKY